jgi:hypothetical protein
VGLAEYLSFGGQFRRFVRFSKILQPQRIY